MDRLTQTALAMAAIRATESRRTHRLFDDPYARLFLEAIPAFDDRFGAETKSLGAMFAAHGAIRTRFFNNYLLGSRCHQVVLLAAGLDTRVPPDLVTAGATVRTRSPRRVRGQEAVLAEHEPACERITLPIDLREDWRRDLIEVGFDVTSPTAWLAEGLLIYLSPGETTSLLTAVSELSAPGSKLAFKHSADDRLVDQASAMPSMAEFTKFWKSGPDQDLVTWLGAHGWRAELHRHITYGRTGFSGEFVTAEFAHSPN